MPTAILAGICCILDPQIRNPHFRNHSGFTLPLQLLFSSTTNRSVSLLSSYSICFAHLLSYWSTARQEKERKGKECVWPQSSQAAFQDLLSKMDDRAQHVATCCRCSACASHVHEYLHCGFEICRMPFVSHLVKGKFTLMFLCYRCFYDIWSRFSCALCFAAGTLCDLILKMSLLCFAAAHWALSAITANPPPASDVHDYPMNNNWSNNQVSLCPLCLLFSPSALPSLLCLCQTEHVPTKRSSTTAFREKRGSRR